MQTMRYLAGSVPNFDLSIMEDISFSICATPSEETLTFGVPLMELCLKLHLALNTRVLVLETFAGLISVKLELDTCL